MIRQCTVRYDQALHSVRMCPHVWWVLFATLLSAAFIGCDTTLPSPTVDDAAGSRTTTVGPGNSLDIEPYPEQDSVRRLIARAVEFQNAGNYKAALSVVERALRIDPNSYLATKLRAKLREVLERV